MESMNLSNVCNSFIVSITGYYWWNFLTPLQKCILFNFLMTSIQIVYTVKALKFNSAFTV